MTGMMELVSIRVTDSATAMPHRAMRRLASWELERLLIWLAPHGSVLAPAQGVLGSTDGDRGRQGTVSGNVEHQSDTAHVGHHVGTAVTEEGQGNACDGHDADTHTYVLKDVEQEHGHHPDDDQSTELVIGVEGQTDHVQDDEQVNPDEADASHKTEGFPDGGKNEVGPVGRHIVELAHGPVHKGAYAEHAAGTDGHLGLGLLVGGGGGIGGRVKEGQDALQTVGIRTGEVRIGNDDANQNSGSKGKAHIDFPVDPGEPHHDRHHEDNHQKASHFAGAHDDDAGEGDDEHHVPDVLKGTERRVFLGQNLGQNQDHGDFGKLRGLNRESPQCIQPGFHACGAVEDPHGGQHQGGGHKEALGIALQPLVGHIDQNRQYDGGDEHIQTLPHGIGGFHNMVQGGQVRA